MLAGLATVKPEFHATQSLAAQFMARVLNATLQPPALDKAVEMVEKLYASSGIHTRYSVLSDWLAPTPEEFQFFPPNWSLEPFPSTAERMKVYEKTSLPLAEQAGRQALSDAGVKAEEVTHLIIGTCTGFFAPGLDILLSQRLGIRPTVSRLILGFMGCYAGFNGLRTADQIIRGDPQAVVLHVCVELCTLHFQKKATPELLVANCLFADGCSAAVYTSAQKSPQAKAKVQGWYSFVDGQSLDQMTWHIGDTGFEMRLSTNVPRTLHSQAVPFLNALTDRAGISRNEVAHWAIHPGGRRILEALCSALELEHRQVEAAYRVLHDYGNMSSATLYYVLQAELQHGLRGPLVAMGFGPGLTIEGAVLTSADV